MCRVKGGMVPSFLGALGFFGVGVGIGTDSLALLSSFGAGLADPAPDFRRFAGAGTGAGALSFSDAAAAAAVATLADRLVVLIAVIAAVRYRAEYAVVDEEGPPR